MSRVIESMDEFERHLSQLDPEHVAFVLRVDELIVQLSPSLKAYAYQPIFRFFEAHPGAHCGAPGTLVHHVEAYYPNYVTALVESVRRISTYNTVLMVHRILNSEL